MHRSEAEFKRLYLCDFAPTEKEKALWAMASEYHQRCEAYDKRVCTHRNERGIAMPVTAQEHIAINRNAKEIRQLVVTKHNTDEFNFAPEEIQLAISRHPEIA